METQVVTKREQRQSALEYIEKLVDKWDRTAINKKRVITVWRKRVMLAMLIGAAFGLASKEVQDISGVSFTVKTFVFGLDEVFAVISAVAIALSTFAGAKILSSDLEKSQLKARAACEALKVQGYLYAMQAPPYSGKNAESLLFKRIEIILKEVSSVAPELSVHKKRSALGEFLTILYMGKGDENSNPDQKLKFKEDMTFHEYVEERVNGQVDEYYRKKAAEFQRIISRANAAMLLFGFAGVVIGTIGATYSTGLSMWIGLLSTASASVASYIHANKYEFLLMSYVSTAGQLELLSARYRSMVTPSEKAQRRFVAETETIFANEHNAWISEIAGSQDEDAEPDDQPEAPADSGKSTGEQAPPDTPAAPKTDTTTKDENDENI